MDVSLKHPQFLVPANGADLSNAKTALEQTGDCLMPKVMKVKIRYFRAATEAFEGEPHRIPRYRKDEFGHPASCNLIRP